MYILHAGIHSVTFLMNVNSKSSDTIPSSKVQKPTNAHRIIKGPEWKDNWQLCAPEDVVTPVLRVCVTKP